MAKPKMGKTIVQEHFPGAALLAPLARFAVTLAFQEASEQVKNLCQDPSRLDRALFWASSDEGSKKTLKALRTASVLSPPLYLALRGQKGQERILKILRQFQNSRVRGIAKEVLLKTCSSKRSDGIVAEHFEPSGGEYEYKLTPSISEESILKNGILVAWKVGYTYDRDPTWPNEMLRIWADLARLLELPCGIGLIFGDVSAAAVYYPVKGSNQTFLLANPAKLHPRLFVGTHCSRDAALEQAAMLAHEYAHVAHMGQGHHAEWVLGREAYGKAFREHLDEIQDIIESYVPDCGSENRS